ncbi:MAG TPA: sialidase family protein [Humisphaera sp.]|jgi:hypothetical protein|nr:sialidase family protein [Humisphaera sp.]
MTFLNRVSRLAIAFVLLGAMPADAAPTVSVLRVPAGSVQPQVAIDATGTEHLIYLTGDPQKSDVFYARSTDGGATFSKPLRVNTQPGSAIAMGTVRGAHLAIGRGNRVHVAWMGSGVAQPKGPRNSSPMLYTRLADDGTFDPQRNVMQARPGLDGGASIAADGRGEVYIAWHAPLEQGAGEQSRQVWMVQSTNDGATFAAERSVSDGKTGACGCCGMRLFCTTEGQLFALYRSADQITHRNVTLLRFDAQAKNATSEIVGRTEIGTCVMSTEAFAANGRGAVAAWETHGQIFWARVDADPAKSVEPIQVPRGPEQKHPALAVNSSGQTLVVWTEGTAWNKGGAIAWQIYDQQGKPLGGIGHAQNLPVWGAPAAFARPNGEFVVIY